MKVPSACTLRGKRVTLVPLAAVHTPDLYAAFAEDPAVWQWLPFRPPTNEDEMRACVDVWLARGAAGTFVPFAQIDNASGRAVGQTSYLEIQPDHGGIEIGGTWLGVRAQRTGINREAKYLLLRNAFEELGAVRVQLKTDARNAQSQTAIAALGAVREGTIRKHLRRWDGFVRDSVLFSILDTEWPAVKARLESQLG
jgi:RimJ/RimL family protein N-acetyltransferase